MLKRAGTLVWLAGILAFAAPAGASAAVTIGSNLLSLPGEAAMPTSTGVDNCSAAHRCTILQRSLPAANAAPGGIVAPVAGVITHFRVKAKTSMAPIVLRVLEPTVTAHKYTGAGTSTTFMPPAGDPAVGTISPSYDVRMPISAGDSLGLDCCQGAANGVYNFDAATAVDDVWGSGANLPLADGESRSSDNNHSNHELLVQADIEPDADHDGYGDETQDLCPTNAAIQTACPATPAGPAGPLMPVAAKCKKAKKQKRAAAAKKKTKCKKTKKHGKK